MNQIDPNDFKLKPSQIILYFIATGLHLVLFLMNYFPLLCASLMALGVMIILILLEYLIVDIIEKRKKK